MRPIIRCLYHLIIYSAVWSLSAVYSPLNATTLQLDPTQSSLTFTVKKLNMLSVTGSFLGLGLTATVSQLDTATPVIDTLTGTIDVNSIFTGNSMRDRTLRGPSFFKSTQHPYITVKIHGPLTLADTVCTATITSLATQTTHQLPITITRSATPTGPALRIMVQAYPLSRQQVGVTAWPWIIANTVYLSGELVLVPYP